MTYAIQKARENFQLPILVWILLLVLLVSIVVALIVVCCVCMKVKHRKTERKQQKTNNTQVSSHINGFSQDFHIPSSEMFQPKFVAKPQSYSTQKLYQWCQEREMQHYKSLWAVNTNGMRFSKKKTLIYCKFYFFRLFTNDSSHIRPTRESKCLQDTFVAFEA